MPSCYNETYPTARKPHWCVECRGIIQPGEKYRKTTGVWDHRGATIKQCADCAPLYDEAVRQNNDEGPAFGSLWDDMRYYDGEWVQKWDAIEAYSNP